LAVLQNLNHDKDNKSVADYMSVYYALK